MALDTRFLRIRSIMDGSVLMTRLQSTTLNCNDLLLASSLMAFTGGAGSTGARLTGTVDRLSMAEFTELVTRQIPVSPFAETNLNLVFNDVSLTLDECVDIYISIS